MALHSELLSNGCGLSDDVVLAALFLSRLVLQVPLVDLGLVRPLHKVVPSHRNIVFFKYLVDLAAIPQYLLRLEVVDLDRLESVHVLECLLHREAGRVEADEHVNLRPALEGLIEKHLLAELFDL